MILGIDHILIAVEDLDKAMALYRRLGFQVLRGGEHPQVGTENALVPLADGAYLELIAVKEAGQAAQGPLTRQVLDALGRANRFAGFALETRDYDADLRAARERGLLIQKGLPGERVRPDGQRVGWRTAHPENPTLPFLIQDLTPRALRVPGPTEGLGGATRVDTVEVGVTDLQPALTAYAQLLGEKPVEGRFRLQRGTIKLFSSMAGDGVQLVLLATENLEGLARAWQAEGLDHYDHGLAGVGRVLVPRDTAGARLSLCQRLS